MYFCAGLADCILFQLFACSGTLFCWLQSVRVSVACILLVRLCVCVCVRACVCVCPAHFLDFVQLNICHLKTWHTLCKIPPRVSNTSLLCKNGDAVKRTLPLVAKVENLVRKSDFSEVNLIIYWDFTMNGQALFTHCRGTWNRVAAKDVPDQWPNRHITVEDCQLRKGGGRGKNLQVGTPWKWNFVRKFHMLLLGY